MPSPRPPAFGPVSTRVEARVYPARFVSRSSLALVRFADLSRGEKVARADRDAGYRAR